MSAYDSISTEALLSLDSMEGVYSLPVVEKKVEQPKAAKRDSVWPGYYLTALTAAIAYCVHYLPFAPFRIAGDSGVRRPISSAIVATLAASYSGRLFGLWPKTALLIGAGTAICGNSAIVAVAPLIDAADEDVTLSVGTVNVMGLLLMFLLPLAGGVLKLSDEAFGVWAGSTIHAVPQVVAAAFAYSQKAGTLATLVKLVRVTLLAPFVIVLMLIYARRRKTGAERHAAV